MSLRSPGHARHGLALAAALLLIAPNALAAPVVGFVEDWPGTSTQGWAGGPSHIVFSNPGTGGVGGAADGYLLGTMTASNFFGARSFGAEYTGDWTAAGVQAVRFALNDVGVTDGFEIHFCIGTLANFWQYNTGYIAPANQWSSFTVDLSDSNAFTHIIASDGLGYAFALQNATAILLRHDLAPFGQFPDTIRGDVGIDRVELLGTQVGVGDPPAIPRALTLRAPQPNPSRGPVAFAIETSDAGPVTLEIVDVQGRRVRREVLAAGTAGPRTWLWDGLDLNGRRVAAGSYRVRATGGSGGASRSLVRLGE